MSKRLTISLTEEQRTELTQLTRSGTAPARTLTRARVLLLADRSQGQARTNKTVAEATGLHHITVGDLLGRFAAEGLDATLYDKSRPGQTPKITGDIEVHLITLCCSDPPEGAARWTLRLLADKIVAQGHLDTISHVFVAKMEDVLEVYQRPYNPARPVVCLDEKSKELHTTPHGILPAEPKTVTETETLPGKPRREDYEYERNGTRNLFLWVEPLSGKRQVCVTERRTGLDFAQQLKSLVAAYPVAEQVVLVTDNLNTHTAACLYEAFAPDQARRIAAKIEWHHTPEHGSWLNMAETELSVLSRQCLNRRIGDATTLAQEVAVWQEQRNRLQAPIRWQFTTEDARIKLRQLYPILANIT